MKKLLILVVAVLSFTACKKEVTHSGTVVKNIYVQVWENKPNCTSLDSLSDSTQWYVYSESNAFGVAGELDTAHYFYRPSGIPNNFERFKYRKIN